MAENGIELEKAVISVGDGKEQRKTHYREIGMFAGYAGCFESLNKRVDNNTFEIISTGNLVDKDEQIRFSVRIICRVQKGEDQKWITIHWLEENPV